ncbi:hypothetical protein AB0C33_01865 [Nonomuraea sp. NPDC048881]|uniref:hypothetical protein n=1 Tax=Nonomuraea sp. NPDC048881 TaxID=3155030 RepID=UPI003409FB6E
MRRFTFTTTATPRHQGEGVDFGDGTAAYRLKENTGAWSKPYAGRVQDIAFQYGGLDGYSFSYIDA